MHLMRVRASAHWAFSGARAVDNETSPAFLHESLAKRMALLFPVIDAAPVHDHGRGCVFRQSQVTDDHFVLERNRYAFDRNIEILGCRQKHLAGFSVAVTFAGRAGKWMTRDTVIAVGF